jgi:DNA-binding XRE family transcriptional regulator
MSPDTTPADYPGAGAVQAEPKRLRRPQSHTRTRAKTLKGWRLLHGLNQRDAARYLGLSQTTYGRLEMGTRFPRPGAAKRLMVLTGLSLATLMGIDQ